MRDSACMQGSKGQGVIAMETAHTHVRAVESNMGAVRKRKANKYLLTQQKWRRVGHSWKQKAEDEKRRARKPGGRGPCASLVLEWKTRGRRRRDESREDGTEGRREGRASPKHFQLRFLSTRCVFCFFTISDNHYLEFWDDCCFHIYLHKRIWDLEGNLTHPDFL